MSIQCYQIPVVNGMRQMQIPRLAPYRWSPGRRRGFRSAKAFGAKKLLDVIVESTPEQVHPQIAQISAD
jgi:hypothetical protein